MIIPGLYPPLGWCTCETCRQTYAAAIVRIYRERPDQTLVPRDVQGLAGLAGMPRTLFDEVLDDLIARGVILGSMASLPLATATAGGDS